MARGSKCQYCHGHGLYRSYWRLGYRRPMEAGPNGRPMHRSEIVVQCDRCGLPEAAEPTKK